MAVPATEAVDDLSTIVTTPLRCVGFSKDFWWGIAVAVAAATGGVEMLFGGM